LHLKAAELPASDLYQCFSPLIGCQRAPCVRHTDYQQLCLVENLRQNRCNCRSHHFVSSIAPRPSPLMGIAGYSSCRPLRIHNVNGDTYRSPPQTTISPEIPQPEYPLYCQILIWQYKSTWQFPLILEGNNSRTLQKTSCRTESARLVPRRSD
jgi:hypothetical protein